MKKNWLLLSFMPFLILCGKKSSDSNTDTNTSTSTNSNSSTGTSTNTGIATVTAATTLATDPEVTTALVGSNLSELSAALSAGDTTGDNSTTLNLEDSLDLSDSGSISRTRTCTADAAAKTATVNISYSGTESKTKLKITVSETASGTETRVWSNTTANSAIQCTKNGLYAAIAWKNSSVVNGLELQVTTKRNQNFTTTFTNRKGESKQRVLTNNENGTRTIKWSTPTGASDTTTTTKTVVSSVTRTQELTKMTGDKIDMTGIHATLTEDPLVVSVTRDATTAKPLTHTIKSGTTTITKVNKFYITNKFSDLLFDMSSTDPCTPVSGTISTKIFKSSTDTNPVKTYDITFTANVATISGDSTASDDLVSNINHKCDFVGGE